MSGATACPDVAATTVDESRRRLGVVAFGAGLYALSGPGQTAGFSVFVDPVTEAFAISRGELTAVYLVATMAAAPAGMWIGRKLDRHRLSSMIRFVAGGLAIALVVAALSPWLAVLAVGVFAMRAFGQSGLTLTSSVYVARSINERRGAALGILAAVGGFAITLTPLVSSRLIPAIGWRQTWLVLAVVVALGGWSLARRMGNIAVAEGGDDWDATVDVDAVPETVLGDERQRRWAFVVLASGFGTTAAVSTALAFHQVAVLGERGLSASAAATNFLPQSLAAATTAIAVGRLVDRVPGRVVVPANMMLLTTAMCSVWLVQSSLTAVLFGVLIGAAAASTAATEGALLVRWTGTASLGRRRGRMMAVVVTSSAVGPLLFTLLADAVGSYARAATAAIALPIAVAIAAACAPLPAESGPSTNRAPEHDSTLT